MRDLADTYIEARLGKAAAADVATADPTGVQAYLTMPQLDEKTLAIRNAIEESVRKERQLKAKAKALTAHARYRLTEAPKAGFPGQVSDLIRAIIPGLSPAASADGVEKTGGLTTYTTPQAEKKYDLMHMLAAGGGAGLGALSQRGMLGSDPQKLKEFISALGGAGEKGITVPDALKDPKVLKQMASAGSVRNIFGRLKSMLPWAKKLKGLGQRRELLALGRAPKIGLGGWKGALAGAALVSLPFALRRWWINRQMRARGGHAAAEAATTAEANIAAAEKLQSWRKKQLAQLEKAVGPGAPPWAAPAQQVPGPAPAPAPTPGPFSSYELTPFQVAGA